MPDHSLLNALGNVRRRLLGVSLTSGFGWGLAAAIVVLVACAWLDLALDLPPALRLTCAIGAVACGLALILWTLWMTLRQTTHGALARRLDRVANSGGQILSGVDLFQQYSTGGAVAQGSALSGALAQMAVERAARIASGVRTAAAVPGKPLVWPMTSVAALGVGLGILALAAPRLAATQWSRFTDPFGDHPPYSSITFDIQPGDTKVLYGGALDVRATAQGGAVEQLDLVLLPSDSASTTAPEVLPMFPEPGGAWRATVADVTADGRYFVRTRGARSRQFSYAMVTVPELKDVRFSITPPPYTRRPPYEGPLPQGGIAGLPGTRVQLWAKSNRPLRGGSLRFTPSDLSADPAPTTQPASTTQPAGTVVPGGPQTVALSPTSPGAAETTGIFTITQAGKIELSVTDVAGQASKDTFTAPVSLLHDDRPFVRILEPRPNSYATPDVTLTVQVLAEDDYGISRVQLFRSLNDSRPLPVEAPVPSIPPVRLPVAVPLHLADYGLKPGDTIKLFARVEDNDPAGVKGSESTVVTVQVISREDLDRMTLAREGMEVLQNKYEQAARRLEALDNEIQKAQKELAKLDPNSELGKAAQQKLEDLAQRVLDEADAIAKNAGDDLPFDIDRAMRQQLYDLAADVRAAGRTFDHAAAQLGLSAAAADKALDTLRERLGTKRKDFKDDVADPLEHLAQIFPLKEDEARFTELYERQRDLAERMAALRKSGADDPKVKVRMRDLEAEQRQLRDAMHELLDDIDSHVQALPPDPRLDGLRKTSEAFAKALRESPAADQMQSSETALSEFKGDDGAAKSKEAADTLEQLLSRCQGMGDQAGTCLKFNPKLAQKLGNTVDQLLEAEGLGRTGQMGMGQGGGYSQRRSTLNNVGLYGSLPRPTGKPSRSGGGKSTPGALANGGGGPGDAGDPENASAPSHLKAAGDTGANVPARYRKKVGEYFQRVADELGE